MTALSKARLTHGNEAAREVPVASMLPYTRHVDDHTVATKDGYLLQVIQLDGVAFETADHAMLNHLKEVRNTLLRGLASSRHALYHHIIRREVSASSVGEMTGFCAELDAAWQRKLAGKRLFVNDQYLTVVYRPLRGSAGIAQSLGQLLSSATDRTAQITRRTAELKALYEATESVLGTLARYGARRLGVHAAATGTTQSDVLSFLSYLINQEPRPVALPLGPLDSYLPTKRPLFGRETLELRGAQTTDTQFGAMISIKEYAPGSGAGMLDALLRIPHELVITQSFGFLDKQTALTQLERTGRIMDNAEDAAISLRAQLTDAADDLMSGRIAFGEHHLSVLVKGPSLGALDPAIADTLAALTDLGIVAVREDINLESSYWAQLPGNMAFIARKAAISTRNFAGYASLHNFPQGQRDGNWWGPCVSVLETTSGTPYAFNFHHHDLGNFTVVGPSGSGKTVVLCFLMAQAQRFKPFSVFFDKDRGAEIFVRAIGGNYSVIRPGHPSGFNPLQLDDSPANRAFLREWLGLLLAPHDGTALPPTDRDSIREAVDSNYEVPHAQRRLSVLQALFQGHERPGQTSLATRLRPWWGDGERAWLFDNSTDTLGFETRTTGFDLSHILDDAIGRAPVLTYLFHRVDAQLNGNKSIIFIDEAWYGLKDPAVCQRIEDWERTIRKRGGLVGLGSQSAKSLAECAIGDVIIEQSPTQLFMPNHKADAAIYCERFGLTQEELRWIKELPDDSRCFLIKHGTHSVIARLDLSGEDELLAVLSGREDTVTQLDAIRAEVGDDPNDWLPLFHQRKTA